MLIEEIKAKSEEIYREFPCNPKNKPEWTYNRDVHCFRKRKAFIKGALFILEDSHNYLPGFIKQFGDGPEGELSPEDWNALDFLNWLDLNGFKLIKNET